MRNMSIICRQMKIFAQKRMSEYNLGFPEMVILMYLSANDNVNQEQISRFFEIDKGSIAKTVKKLEDKKLISRNENKEDKRENIISISETAQCIVEKMNEILGEWFSKVFDGLSEDDIESYNRITERMAFNASNIIYD